MNVARLLTLGIQKTCFRLLSLTRSLAPANGQERYNF